MPKVAFSTENKKTNDFDFPKLKLVKDERARLALLEKEPEVEFTHDLMVPKFDDGVPVYEIAKRKDQSTYETNTLDFLARPICYGDFEVLTKDGVDPENCIICRYAADTGHTKAPKRRFAMHVTRYATKPGGFEIATPFNVSNIVWAFTDQIFNKITEFQEQWKDDGGLQKHDLLLGPCENAMYQKADLAVAPSAEWTKDQDRRATTIATYKENQAKDLSIFCGTRISEAFVKRHLETIETAWKEVDRYEGKAAAGNPAASQIKLDAGLDSLLDDNTPKEKHANVSMEDLLATAEKPKKDAEGWALEAPADPRKPEPRAEELPEDDLDAALTAVADAPIGQSTTEAAESEDDEFADFLKGLG